MIRTLKWLALIMIFLICLTGCGSGSEKSEETFKNSVSLQNGAEISNADGYEIKSGKLDNAALPHKFEHSDRLSGFKYYTFWGINNNNDIIMSFDDAEKNKTEIGFYNLDSNTYRTIAVTSDGLIASVAAFNDDLIVCLYYDYDIDGYGNASSYEVHCISTKTSEDTVVLTADELVGKYLNSFVIINDTLYFDLFEGVYLSAVYSFDIHSREKRLIAENARCVMPYNGAVAYLKGNEGIAALIDNNEKIILNSEIFGNVSGISCSNDVFTYNYYLFNDETDSECATGGGVGFIENESRNNLLEPINMAVYFYDLHFNEKGYGIWNSDTSDPILPVFYDCNKKSFVVVSDRALDYACFASDTAVLFISVDEAEQSAEYYLVK